MNYIIKLTTSVGQSRSTLVYTKHAGSKEEDAEIKRARAEGYANKSGRLRTQERQKERMDVELRTEAESRQG